MKGKGKKEKESNDSNSDDSNCPSIQFIDFKPIDHMRQCPRFTAIVERNEDESITSEDLDVLQLELETLLVSVVKRQRLLQTETEALVNWYDVKNRDKKSPNKPTTEVFGKRSKHCEEKPSKKFKDNQSSGSTSTSNSSSSGKSQSSSSRPQKAKNKSIKFSETEYSETQQKGLTKKVALKNDIPNQFWNFIEPYCSEISCEQIKVLSEHLKAYENDSEFYKIPNLGKHYSLKWEDIDIIEQKKSSDKKKGLSASNCSGSSTVTNKSKKGTKNGPETEKTSFGALTQRLVSCLIEENLLNGGFADPKGMSNDLNGNKETNGSPNHKVFKSLNLGNTAQLERRIRKELEEHGIISLDDILNGPDNSAADDDEILEELKRCQQELKALSAKNQTQLKKLLNSAKKEMTRQEINHKLEIADLEVIEAHRRICSAKQKKRPPTKKERESAKKAVKDRELILKQLQSLS